VAYCKKSALIGIVLLIILILAGFANDEQEDTTKPIREPIFKSVIFEQPMCFPIGEYTLTAYCACEKCCGDWADGITYTGTVATEGRTIAVDPKNIPLGSTVEIYGKQYIAEDIGGAIKQNRIDVFFESHSEALKFGKQKAKVYLIK